jgi:ribosome biogenesis GTPase A
LKKQKQKYPLIMERIVETSDIVLEVLDSRFIAETRNLEIEESLKKKHKKMNFFYFWNFFNKN